jgi:hypothetical protein
MSNYVRAAVLWLSFMLGMIASVSAFPDDEMSTVLHPAGMKFERRGSHDSHNIRETEDALRKSSGFDLNKFKVMELFSWKGMSGFGVIAAVREGAGVSAGCAIYEKIGNADFEYVNGQPFCEFAHPSGRIDIRNSRTAIVFKGKIRQSSESPLNSMEFDLFYDVHRGIFCDPLSLSGTYSCGANDVDQKGSIGK